jgi:hypothetical protein
MSQDMVTRCTQTNKSYYNILPLDRQVKDTLSWEVNTSLLPDSFKSPQLKRLTMRYLKQRDSHILDLSLLFQMPSKNIF